MAGFELGISAVRSNRSANCVTASGETLNVLKFGANSLPMMGRGCEVVIVLAFYCIDPSLNPSEGNSFILSSIRKDQK